MTDRLARWSDLERVRPDLAERGRAIFFNFGVGLGFLATIRADGGPRVHPISPVITRGGLYGLILPGPKRDDLQRDGRYALHTETIPPPNQDDGFYITGRVSEVTQPELRDAVGDQLLSDMGLTERWPGFETQIAFEFLFDRCLLTLTQAHGELPSGATVWRVNEVAASPS
jgi:hypothetical protein